MNYPLLSAGALVIVGAIVYATYGPKNDIDTNAQQSIVSTNRIPLETDGTRHSIPLDEILSGGPGKDGIPSIDEPKFLSAIEALYLQDEDPGIGLVVNGEARFYPYRILVWHEIVNDTIAGRPVLVTYCPLCATGIVFDRTIDGVAEEFGVSGKLWQSNLLMYNRATNSEQESLWSQVLGEAVVGVHTGKTLVVMPSDIMRWGDWKRTHQNTRALSSETGVRRDYARDPYGDYYTSESIMFGSQFNDERLHPKALVQGIRIGDAYKAYPDTAIPIGDSEDTLAGTSSPTPATPGSSMSSRSRRSCSCYRAKWARPVNSWRSPVILKRSCSVLVRMSGNALRVTRISINRHDSLN